MRKSPPISKPKIITWIENENGCWICTSHKGTKAGYPFYNYNGKRTTMSRYIYSKYYGELPENVIVNGEIKKVVIMHTCDNPMCINPKHLICGTQKDNLHDMQNKGRKWAPQGNEHPSSKLTKDNAIDILKDKRTIREIAKDYNVHHSTIWGIKKHKYWKNLQEVI